MGYHQLDTECGDVRWCIHPFDQCEENPLSSLFLDNAYPAYPQDIAFYNQPFFFLTLLIAYCVDPHVQWLRQRSKLRVNTQDAAHGGLVVNDESRTPEAVIKTDYPLVMSK